VCVSSISWGTIQEIKCSFPIPHVEGNVAAVAVSTRAEDTFVYGESSFVNRLRFRVFIALSIN